MTPTATDLEKSDRLANLHRSLDSWTLCVNLLTQSIGIPVPNDYAATIMPPIHSTPSLKRDLASLIAGRRQIVVLREMIELESQPKEPNP